MKTPRNKSYEQGLDAGFKSGYEVGFERAKESIIELCFSGDYSVRDTVYDLLRETNNIENFISAIHRELNSLKKELKKLKPPKAMK